VSVAANEEKDASAGGREEEGMADRGEVEVGTTAVKPSLHGLEAEGAAFDGARGRAEDGRAGAYSGEDQPEAWREAAALGERRSIGISFRERGGFILAESFASSIYACC
jgi:hypothetical protein